jgi:hypothetical protein
MQALAEILPHCPHLTDLRFSGTRAAREGSVAVAKALSQSPAAAAGNFTSLDLADNTFGTEGGALLASMLSKQVHALNHTSSVVEKFRIVVRDSA